MTIIPGLPEHIQTIPPAPSSPTDPLADEKRLAWKRWRYQTHQYRVERHRELRDDPDLIPFELQKCAQHPAYFAAIWLRVFEPRWRADPSLAIPGEPGGSLDETDDPDAEMAGAARLPAVPLIVQRNLREQNTLAPGYDPALAPAFGYIPFICFERQVEVMNRLLWTLHQTDETADVVWSKARGWGASWIGCLLALWGWTFSHHWPGAPPWNVLMLSRKEELVDSKQQRSLFWKIRRLMRDLPPWMMPDGFNPDLHDQKGVILNPFNGNELGGESTTSKAGRGDRVTWVWMDEAAFMPSMLNIWSTVAETTDHRWAVSTESFEEGKDFYDLREGNEMEVRPYLIESDWWENPLNDDVWLERQRLRFAAKPEAFAQEVLRVPYTGSTWVYEWAHDIELRPGIKPISGRASYVAIDPGYRDPTALIAIQEDEAGNPVVLDAYQIEGKESDYFAPLLKPSLFAEQDEHWDAKEHVVWQSPLDPTLIFEYDERALRFARCVAAMGGTPTYVGDTYGETMIGATKDSVYSRWRSYGIPVRKDRKTGEAVTTSVRQQRTFTGRKEAMDMLSRRWVFADTQGAAMVKKALKESSYKVRPEKPGMSEPREPLHDWTSHLRSALEFYATYKKYRIAVAGRDLSKPLKMRMGRTQTNNFGGAALRATLGGIR